MNRLQSHFPFHPSIPDPAAGHDGPFEPGFFGRIPPAKAFQPWQTKEFPAIIVMNVYDPSDSCVSLPRIIASFGNPTEAELAGARNLIGHRSGKGNHWEFAWKMIPSFSGALSLPKETDRNA